MSQSGSGSNEMIQIVERARAEVNMLKAALAPRNPTNPDGEGGAQLRTHLQRIQAAEVMLDKAELSIQRVKHAGRVPSRSPQVIPEAERASRAARALAVLTGGGPPGRLFVPSKPMNEYAALRLDEIPVLCKRAAEAAKIEVGPLKGTHGRCMGFICENVFRAFMWFKDAPSGKDRNGWDVLYVAPEHIAVFGMDENGATRWSASKHAVFGVLTERANAAVRYFWARERLPTDAFVALAKWLALHKNMFSDKCEGRRLAFDASRGLFLPACVRSFDGVGGPRFTRGSIPVRTSSTAPYSRTQGGSNANGQGNTQAGQGSNGRSR